MTISFAMLQMVDNILFEKNLQSAKSFVEFIVNYNACKKQMLSSNGLTLEQFELEQLKEIDKNWFSIDLEQN